MIEILDASTPGRVEQARNLFVEYAASLGLSLCFQNFEQELAGLPGAYAPPRGALLLAVEGAEPLACVALRPLEGPLCTAEGAEAAYQAPIGLDETCEMKRLYVRPQARGRGLGRAMAERIVAEARLRGYRRMRLDTLPSMGRAIALYESLGFKDIPAYCVNPHEGARYLELEL
ncbi:GNAT family N-acetyltransferase [Fundidesulfovibrio soli]|uniref:GNAT family N-acetyltransferase n=1 Tax=Fundidesulfovibrio soli TaxID=2922716 RepID=UPI001FAF4C1A|nr:GNAT family N-acetyltransferase [Fundidesulfovibrio soli]